MVEGKEVKALAGEKIVQQTILLSEKLVIHNFGEIEEDVTNRIKEGWLKRNASGILCDNA